MGRGIYLVAVFVTFAAPPDYVADVAADSDLNRATTRPT